MTSARRQLGLHHPGADVRDGAGLHAAVEPGAGPREELPAPGAGAVRNAGQQTSAGRLR